MRAFFLKFFGLFSIYPVDSLITPSLLSFKASPNKSNLKSKKIICIQGVQERFYFLLFGKIAEQLKLNPDVEIHILASRSINSSVGSDWLANIKRWAIFSWLISKQWERVYGNVFDDIAYRANPIFQPISDLRRWAKSKKLWELLKRQEKEFSLIIDGVEYADLIIDTFLRFNPAPHFDVNSKFVRRVIWQLLRDISQAEKYFGSVKPSHYLSSYSTYTVHGAPCRVALKHGVEVITFGEFSDFSKRLSITDPYHSRNCSSYRIEFEKLDSQQEKLDEAKHKLSMRLGGQIDAAISYMRVSAYSMQASQFDCNELEGSVVIFLHDFYDSPHIVPGLVFNDFWEWVCFTIEVLQQSKIKFYLKPHPNQIEMNADVIEELKKKYPNLLWLECKVNNVELVKAGIVCGVTVYGTISHELAFMGVPSIACAQHPHHEFDFCRTAKTREEYKSMLQLSHKLPIDLEEMRRQALVFYYMHNLNRQNDEKKLVESFVKLFSTSNYGGASHAEILQCLNELTLNKKFGEFLEKLNLSLNEN